MRRFFARARALHERGVLGMNQRNAALVLPLNPRRHVPRVDDKLLTKRLAEAAGIPTPRSLGAVRSDGIKGIDFSVVKNTRIYESVALQFRAEFFNLTNTVRFAPPNTSFGAAAFGQVSAQSNQPRVVQFALKLIY